MKSQRIFTKRNNTKRKAAKILLTFGFLLTAIGLGYQAINYPWTASLIDWGIITVSADTLPDPKPLQTTTKISGAHVASAAGSNRESPDSGTQDAETAVGAGIPGQPDYFTARPDIEVQQLGIIKLPDIGVSENIVEGTEDELFYGVGHVRGTAMPGEKGNCVLAGHRNYVIMHPFRHLDKVEIGDSVYIKENERNFRYEVFKIFIINPEDDWVLAPQEEEEHLLTLITCTPVLNPAQRLILWCRLVDPEPVSG